MNGWDAAWYAWLAVVVLGFLAIELPALANRADGDTLSEHFWRWLKVADPRPSWLVWTLRALLAAFLGWLALHLTLGWFTPSDPWP